MKKGLDKAVNLTNPNSKWKKRRKQHPYMDKDFVFDTQLKNKTNNGSKPNLSN